MEGQPSHLGVNVSAPGLRVLVVEDHADSATSLAMLLRISGHEVRVAQDGLAALEMARSDPPDVVLLDLGLPGLDGWQVAERLRRQSAPKRPLFIALTGYGREEDRRRSEEAGIELHLLKPADPVQLLRLLARFHRLLTQPGDQTPLPFPGPHCRSDLWMSGRGKDPSPDAEQHE
jgi:two-component system, OmpR family, response regulator